MHLYQTERVGLFIDGANLYATVNRSASTSISNGFLRFSRSGRDSCERRTSQRCSRTRSFPQSDPLLTGCSTTVSPW